MPPRATGNVEGPPSQAQWGRGRAPAVSIRDVARAAGVSYQTVSRVINESPSVRPSTRQLVLETIAALGFRPNRAARALAGGPIQAVTVLTANTRLYGPSAALEGIEEATRAAGFALGVRVVESGTPTDVRDAVERAIEPAGALIVIAYDRPGIDTLNAVPGDVPVAGIVETPLSPEDAPKTWVWIDDRKAARDATYYLLGLGHPTVHYVTIPTWMGTSPRTAGWLSALKDAGAPLPKPLEGGWGPRSGYEAGRRLAVDQTVTAVLCGNDEIAIGVMRAMREAGRAVPEEVSIVGFDDTPLTPFYTPPLTTMRQDFQALGHLCFAKLQSVLGTNRAEEPPWPQAELVIRESAGPPPSRRRARALPTRAPAKALTTTRGAKLPPKTKEEQTTYEPPKSI
ncbi:MAG: LacI family DNA-binding transcriptional regulator [Acidimicrobiales bacterium]